MSAVMLLDRESMLWMVAPDDMSVELGRHVYHRRVSFERPHPAPQEWLEDETEDDGSLVVRWYQTTMPTHQVNWGNVPMLPEDEIRDNPGLINLLEDVADRIWLASLRNYEIATGHMN